MPESAVRKRARDQAKARDAKGNLLAGFSCSFCDARTHTLATCIGPKVIAKVSSMAPDEAKVCMELLTPRQREAVEALLGGKRPVDFARERGVTKVTMFWLIKRALRHLEHKTAAPVHLRRKGQVDHA